MRLLGLSLLAAGLVGLTGSQVLAQSGVQSGPPQVQGGPGPSPGTWARAQAQARAVDQRPGVSQEGWVAVAAGFRDGRWVRVGFARRGTRGDAEIAAIDACNGGPGGVRCTNPYATSSACLYIVAGKRQGGVTWGRGATQDVALSECRRGGYTCREQGHHRRLPGQAELTGLRGLGASGRLRPALIASVRVSRRGSRRSRGASCGPASRPRHTSRAAGRAGTWNRPILRRAPA